MSRWVISYVAGGKRWTYPPMTQHQVADRVRRLMRKRMKGTPTEITIRPDDTK